MPGTSYDYLVSIFAVGMLFVAAVVAVPNLNYVNILYVDQQQLRNVALNLLKTILVNVGYPSNWGSTSTFDQNTVGKFGLALSSSSSFYVLDPDKVQRLVIDNPLGHMEYDKVRELLKLNGYGFSLNISAPFNVAVEDLSDEPDELEFEVTVTFNDGRPVPNAIVNAIIVYTLRKSGQGGEEYITRLDEAEDITNELGRCEIEKELEQEEISDLIVVFKTTVGDVTTLRTVWGKFFQPSNVVEVGMVNDEINISLPYPPPPPPRSARHIISLTLFTEEGPMTFYNGTSSDILNYGAKEVWNKTFGNLKNLDPTFLVANIKAVERQQGQQGSLVVGPFPNFAGSRVIRYGGTPQGVLVKLQRTVTVSGMPYNAEISLWKE